MAAESPDESYRLAEFVCRPYTVPVFKVSVAVYIFDGMPVTVKSTFERCAETCLLITSVCTPFSSYRRIVGPAPLLRGLVISASHIQICCQRNGLAIHIIHTDPVIFCLLIIARCFFKISQDFAVILVQFAVDYGCQTCQLRRRGYIIGLVVFVAVVPSHIHCAVPCTISRIDILIFCYHCQTVDMLGHVLVYLVFHRRHTVVEFLFGLTEHKPVCVQRITGLFFHITFGLRTHVCLDSEDGIGLCFSGIRAVEYLRIVVSRTAIKFVIGISLAHTVHCRDFICRSVCPA